MHKKMNKMNMKLKEKKENIIIFIKNFERKAILER